MAGAGSKIIGDNSEIRNVPEKNDLTEVWQSAISKRLLFYRLLPSKPLYKLTITGRQADRQTGGQTGRKSHL